MPFHIILQVAALTRKHSLVTVAMQDIHLYQPHQQQVSTWCHILPHMMSYPTSHDVISYLTHKHFWKNSHIISSSRPPSTRQLCCSNTWNFKGIFMNIIVIIKFMRISFEVSGVAATKLPSGWWPSFCRHWSLRRTIGFSNVCAQ